jgi:predicted negative regulator of RcsB-dependent stress response
MLLEAMQEERDKIPVVHEHASVSGGKTLLIGVIIAYAMLFGYFAGSIL